MSARSAVPADKPFSAPLAIAPERPLTRVADLVEAGLVEATDAPALAQVAERFQVRLTPHVAGLVEAVDDPIARQYLPGTAELDIRPEELGDPIGDGPHSPLKGLTHRYPDRVLLKPTHLCQVYCRFCFRRETVGQGAETLGPAELAAAVGYVAARPAIREVILSGGDPLVLSDRRLGAILDMLDAISHVDVIRLHTRVPVADPARVTDDLVRLLDRRAAVWLVLHVNHPRELSGDVKTCLRRLARGGVGLLSQSVLLKGVNDDAAVLEALFRGLIAARVKPYYLHHLDLAEGTGHFRVSIEEGQALMAALRGRLSGLAQPTYVLDIPGGHGKVPIGPVYLERDGQGTHRVTDPNGNVHAYRDLAHGNVRDPA